ncbi:hypothetical protein WR25_00650 [Diploscapter pachys]|uniref:Ubiquitin-conjugating enzyme E2 J2 n=1 Tax=Diploscapter pachys TaxID=2018661 RepID=A0A2A2JIT6_9BILA|nr:hypothetical protein WR25_00650 [Diploscapter pachys]
MDDYESVCLVKPEIFIYRIPPQASNKGHKAADWKLDEPNWTGRLKLVSINKLLVIKLEDKESGNLYAKCPIEQYPGPAIETVTDSSRYFVIRLKNDSGQTAFVGLGFADRSDSFDFNVALQDHFKYLEKDEQLQKSAEKPQPQLDLAFKEGQTISINIGKKDKSGNPLAAKPRPQAASGDANIVPLLPPPPGPSMNQSRVREMSAPEPTQTAIRRLKRDLEKLQEEPIDGITAMALDTNILEWHYVICGTADTPYEGGLYHGKLVFPPDFPWKPPSIYMMTPNGRFIPNYRLCLTISDYHPETWNPGWTVSAILVGLHSFMNEDSIATGCTTSTDQQKRQLAQDSIHYNLRDLEFCRCFPEWAEELRKTVGK